MFTCASAPGHVRNFLSPWPQHQVQKEKQVKFAKLSLSIQSSPPLLFLYVSFFLSSILYMRGCLLNTLPLIARLDAYTEDTERAGAVNKTQVPPGESHVRYIATTYLHTEKALYTDGSVRVHLVGLRSQQ